MADLDDRVGPVRDRLVATQRDWLETLTTAVRIAIDEGHFRKDLDAAQLAYEFLAAACGSHLIGRLLRDGKNDDRTTHLFERLLKDARAVCH
jgi:hypothetical protein